MTTNVTAVAFAPGVGIFEVPSSGQWVDLTPRVREITTGPLGRDHELGRTQAGTFSIRLDNRDRALDPTNIAGPYFGQLKPKVQIRVQLDGVGLVYGFIDDYNQQWPSGPMAATQGDAEVVLGCSDAFDIFSNYDLASYRSVVLGDSPAGYWPLDDPVGSQGAQDLGNSGNASAPQDPLIAQGPLIFEVQHIQSHLGTASGGTYQLGFKITSFLLYSSPIPWNASPSVVQTAINTVVGGNFVVVVTGGPTINAGYDFAFQRPGDQNPIVVLNPASITGDTIDVTTTVPGGATMIGASFGFSPGPLASNATTMDFDGTPSNIPIAASYIRDGGNLWFAGAFEFWIQPSSLTAGDGIAAFWETTSTDAFPLGTAWRIYVGASGAITLDWQQSVGNFVSTTSPPGLLTTTDGWLHIGIIPGNQLTSWYKNGLIFGTSAGIVPKGDTEDVNHVASIALGYTPAFPTHTFNGQLAHFAVYQSLDGSRFAAHYLARSEVFSEADSGTIIAAILDAVGWPMSARSIDTGSTIIQSIDPSGSALDLMLSVGEDTEGGIVQMDGDGNFVFISRHNVALNNALAQLTFGDAGSDVHYRDLVVDNDTSKNLLNIVKATRVGGPEQTVFNQPSIDEVGPRTKPFSGLLFTNDEDTLGFASTQLSKYETQRERPKSMTLFSRSGDNVLNAIKALTTKGDHILVKRLPPGGGATLALEAQIEGVTYRFQLDGHMWITTYALIPANVGIWILGLSALGIDTFMGW